MAPKRKIAVLKTARNSDSVDDFLNTIADDEQRKDSRKLVELMEKVTKHKAAMYGKSIVGFGDYYYKYASGREGDWFTMGFSPRKNSLTLYITRGFNGYQELLDAIGKHKTGKGCLYLKNLEGADEKALAKFLRQVNKDSKPNAKKPRI